MTISGSLFWQSLAGGAGVADADHKDILSRLSPSWESSLARVDRYDDVE